MEEVHSQHMLRTGGRAAGKLSKPALSVSRHNAEGEKGSADPAYSFFFFSSHSFFYLCVPSVVAETVSSTFQEICFQLEFEHDDTEP